MTADHEQHREYEELAVRHVMGALDSGEASTFRSHLLDCGDCRARVGELRSIASELAGVERDERRQRAVNPVETKERDGEDDTGEEDRESLATPRGGRAMVIVGVLLIIVLSVWNFVLRGQNEGLEAALEAEQEAAEVINFGAAWEESASTSGVQGVVRVEQGALAAMVRGTDDDAAYHVTLFDAEGEQLDREPIPSVNQQVRYYRSQVPAAVARVDVTLDRASGETVVFRASETADE